MKSYKPFENIISIGYFAHYSIFRKSLDNVVLPQQNIAPNNINLKTFSF
jgi:hypothetical protein